jgi:hypothetical protein
MLCPLECGSSFPLLDGGSDTERQSASWVQEAQIYDSGKDTGMTCCYSKSLGRTCWSHAIDIETMISIVQGHTSVERSRCVWEGHSPIWEREGWGRWKDVLSA